MITTDLNESIRLRGMRILERASAGKGPVWARERWEEALMRRIMSDEGFKTQALRFVDVLPALRSDKELVRHLQEYFGDEGLPIPGVAQWGLALAQRGGLAATAAGAAVRKAITGMAYRFIGGADVREAFRAVERIRKDGMAFTLDVLGEATVNEAEADHYQRLYLQLIDELPPKLGTWPAAALLDETSTRPNPRLDLSVKLSALYSQMNPSDPAGSTAAVKERLRPILHRAREKGAAVTFDMEQYDLKEITLRAFRELLLEEDFRDWPDAGIAIQAYLRDAEPDLRDLAEWAKQRGAPVSVRLVRGAYWDYETVIARQFRWPVPVYTEKCETDICYERCVHLLFDNFPHLEPAIATHNVRSIALALSLAELRGLDPRDWEVQMLYGMADALKEAVVQEDVRMRVYVPFGELIPGMAYLVRRLLENTASQSFLRLGFAEQVGPEELLQDPATVIPCAGASDPLAVQPPIASGTAFDIEPVFRFTDEGERREFAQAVAEVKARLGERHPLVIGGKEIDTEETIHSEDPSQPSVCVGLTASASVEQANQAVEVAAAAFPAWRDTPPEERARLLKRSAEIMRRRRRELAAWQVFEVGKNWREADADVTEAIDFLDYYADELVRLARGYRFDVAGEDNELFYEPRGVAAIIPPWNFPLAILTGMTSAALVAGNTVVMKPASQSPIIAAQLMEIFREAELPAGVANFVPGPGRDVGEALVKHPKTAMIAFTGSREVGVRIMQVAAEIRPGQDHLKYVIAELGGKNAIIIDSDADLDDAVVGTVVSAFGFQGQKCSACSRAIVLAENYDLYVKRLLEAANSVRIGHPEHPGNFMGPVVEKRAYERIRRTIAEAKEYATLALERDVSQLGAGYFIPPTVFTDVPPDSDLAQEEIFGPVLAVLKARDFDHALELANGTSYALTGGIYSRSPQRIERAKREFRVGNLYINRKISGAIVGRQPFGGGKMSGTGSKAGGPDYLLHFMLPRTVTENTLRRGFAPQEQATTGPTGSAGEL